MALPIEWKIWCGKEKTTDSGCKWMNLKDMMSSERSQTQKKAYGMIHFIGNVQKSKSIRHRKQIRGCLGMREGTRRDYKQTWGSFGGNGNVLKLQNSMNNYTKIIDLYVFLKR